MCGIISSDPPLNQIQTQGLPVEYTPYYWCGGTEYDVGGAHQVESVEKA
jgi:hypothetical protein